MVHTSLKADKKKDNTKSKPTANDKKSAFQFKNPYGWFDTRPGAITAIAASFAFIAIFIFNIVINHTWISAVFVILYGMIIVNRLKLLRSMHE